MNIQFDKTSNVTAEMTITIEKTDYQERVDKALKDYRKKASLPGFRPGQVPVSLLQKRFGAEITAEEVQKLLSEKLFGYLREQKVNTLGEPLASEKQQPINFAAEKNDFIFDIALAPEFDATVSANDKIPYYTITVEDEMVDRQVQAYTQRGGHYDKVDEWKEGDMTKGVITELGADGIAMEGGVVKEDAVILPAYFKDEDQKVLFQGVKVDTVMTFNPHKAYQGSTVELSSLLGISKEEAETKTGDFQYQVTEITRYVPAALDQELFDQVFGTDTVKSEEEFRGKIKEQLAAQFVEDADYRFLIDVRQYLEQRIGDVEWPDALLQRIMRLNNPDKDDKYFEDNYAGSIAELKWHLIKEQLCDQLAIKVEQADVLATAKEQTRMQFAQYGMSNIPEEIIEKYASEMLGKKEQVDGLVGRTVERKLGVALKGAVKLTKKKITMEKFNKLFEKK